MITRKSHPGLKDYRKKVRQPGADDILTEKKDTESVQFQVCKVHQTRVEQRKIFSFHVSTIIGNPGFCESLLLGREEVEALVRVLREVDNP